MANMDSEFGFIESAVREYFHKSVVVVFCFLNVGNHIGLPLHILTIYYTKNPPKNGGFLLVFA